MQDTFKREINIGDIIVRILDWGATYLSVVQGTTPAGYLRIISYNEKKDEWYKSGILKNTSNIFILDEQFLRAHIEGEYRIPPLLNVDQLVQVYLDQQQNFQEG